MINPTPTADGDMVFSPRRHDMVTTVEIVEDVTGARPMMLTNHMRPTTLKVMCRDHHDGNGWVVDVSLTGPRIRKDGTDGAEVTEHMWVAERVNPDAARGWIAHRVAALVATLPGQPVAAEPVMVELNTKFAAAIERRGHLVADATTTTPALLTEFAEVDHQLVDLYRGAVPHAHMVGGPVLAMAFADAAEYRFAEYSDRRRQAEIMTAGEGK